MANRINSRLVFELLHNVYDCKDSIIYKMLLFYDKTSAGPRFKRGCSDDKTKCTWPKDAWGKRIDTEYEDITANNTELEKAYQLRGDEVAAALPSELQLKTALGVWCYETLVHAFTTGKYEGKHAESRNAILSTCRVFGVAKQRLNYLSKTTVTIEKALLYIVVECEYSSGKSVEEVTEETDNTKLILSDIRAFLEGRNTEKGTVFIIFSSNKEFIFRLFPEICIDDFSSLGLSFDSIVECGYDNEYAIKLGNKFAHDNCFRIKQLVIRCKQLYGDIENANVLYNYSLSTLTNFITDTHEKDEVMSRVRCCTDVNHPYRGFAVLVLYALLGINQFMRLFPSITGAQTIMRDL